MTILWKSLFYVEFRLPFRGVYTSLMLDGGFNAQVVRALKTHVD